MSDLDLTERVILFSRFLRGRGFKVFSSSIVDSLRSLQESDLSVREDFFSILRANLATSEMEWKLFSDLFEAFWQGKDRRESEKEPEKRRKPSEYKRESVPEKILDVLPDQKGDTEAVEKRQTFEGATYSPVALLKRKDLSQFERGDIQIARLILKNMMSPFRIAITRRFKSSKRPGDIDFRRILRKGLKAEGIPSELFYRKRKKRLKKLVILADVSGSMDRYARFVMPFIIGLNGVGSKTEVFVFSTSLTSITPILRRFPIDKALEFISHEVPDWSGGTRIGYSLHQFNEQYGARLLNKRTVVVIMSDGWDLGARDLMRREMEALSQKAHRIVWLNPLASDPEYRPVCRGMQAALPYVDYFLPADSLESLKRVGRTLTRVMAGN